MSLHCFTNILLLSFIVWDINEGVTLGNNDVHRNITNEADLLDDVNVNLISQLIKEINLLKEKIIGLEKNNDFQNIHGIIPEIDLNDSHENHLPQQCKYS